MRRTKLRRTFNRYFPVGSPLWYPYFFSKRCLKALFDSSYLQTYPRYVAHQNILLEEYKAIYFYIPKVACTTLKKVCADLLRLEVGEGDLIENIHLVKFPYANRYRIRERFRDYCRFCFVRNPWSRLVSCYKDKIDYERGHVYERYNNGFIEYLKSMRIFTKGMTFDRFIELICEIPDEMADAHFRSQHRFIVDDKGKLLTDFIGRLEHLDRDFSALGEKLGIKIQLPHLRGTKPRSYAKFYSSKTARMVEQRYQRDIKMFGYEF